MQDALPPEQEALVAFMQMDGAMVQRRMTMADVQKTLGAGERVHTTGQSFALDHGAGAATPAFAAFLGGCRAVVLVKDLSAKMAALEGGA